MGGSQQEAFPPETGETWARLVVIDDRNGDWLKPQESTSAE